ncbi:MAG: DUF3857 domain-containing protein, partial [Bacteroidota bacterium]
MIQINDPDHRSWGDISIPHGDEDQFKILYAEILDLDGSVLSKVNKRDMLTRNAFSNGAFYQDDLVTEFSLFWDRYPYRIRYAYQNEVYNFMYLARWSPPTYESFTPEKSVLEIDLPSNFKIKTSSDPQFQYTEDLDVEDRKVLRWELGKHKISPRENFGPTGSETRTSVLVIPENFHYGIDGNLSTWKSYGDWFLELNKGNTQLTPTEKAKVDKILQEASSERDKVQRLYHYLQDNTTYINVNIDLGGLQSYPASYVCENKYGDCKA